MCRPDTHVLITPEIQNIINQHINSLFLKIGIIGCTAIVVATVIVLWLGRIWLGSQIENSINSKYKKILEDYRYNLKVRERAEKIAEYLSLYYTDSQNFQKLNQLSWELSLWFPSELYANLGKALKNIGPGMDIDKETIFDILIKTRKLLLKEEAGSLAVEDIISHAKGIGKNKPITKQSTGPSPPPSAAP
jgi:hypothetical protein